MMHPVIHFDVHYPGMPLFLLGVQLLPVPR